MKAKIEISETEIKANSDASLRNLVETRFEEATKEPLDPYSGNVIKFPK